MRQTDGPPIARESTASPQRRLGLLDCVCVMVGIVVGAGLFETTPLVAASVGQLHWLVLVWSLGGLVALLGALCYAELATSFPESGGDYVFLTKAYGRSWGFFFAWCEFWIIRPGNVGMLAYVFGRYAQQVFSLPLENYGMLVYASVAVVALTTLNALGARLGSGTQNALTIIKLVGIVWVILAAASSSFTDDSGEVSTFGNERSHGVGVMSENPTATPLDQAEIGDQAEVAGAPAITFSGIYLAMIFVLLTYGGWGEMSYVAAEIRAPEKNIARALIVGTSLVILIYLGFNLACWRALGMTRLSESEAVATEVVGAAMGQGSGRLVSLLVALSCLGAINGMLFTGSRVYFAMGADHRTFSWLGAWSSRFDAPVRSLWLQMLVTVGLILTFGNTDESFEKLVVFTTPVFWFFSCLIAASVMILRRQTRDRNGIFRVWLYPIPPLALGATSVFMLYASLSWALQNIAPQWLWTLAVVLVGIGAAWAGSRTADGDRRTPV